MANAIHISTARAMLNSGDRVSLVLFTSEGKIEHWNDVFSISYDVKNGTRRMRFMTSREIRQCRDCLIMQINNMEIYL